MKWGKPVGRDGWQPWFAWRPVRIYTGEWIWLETVDRAKWFFNFHPNVQSAKMGITGFDHVYRLRKGRK